MAIDLEQVGIDLMDPAVGPMLSDLQGNIFKPHGRKHSAYLVVTFLRDRSKAIREWIRDFAKFYVTTAEAQIKDARRFRKLRMDAGLFVNFFLSAKGYEVLGFSEDQIPSDHGNRFARGMKNEAINAALKDPSPDQWEAGYQREIHALLFLADNGPNLLELALSKFTSELQPLTEQLTVEYGVRWFGPDGKQDIEPFGYADGISQPLFLKEEIDKAKERGIDRWDPSAPLNLVLVKDPHGGEDSYGSFYVFRKLEQDVAGFHRRVAGLAEALGTDTKLAGAYVVGRFQDGTPVEVRDHDQWLPPEGKLDEFTNFNYAEDMAGSRCPFQAHIRKTNPRGDTVRVFEGDFKFERNHRIVRRGVPFGKQPPPGMNPTWPVGLLFACYQSDIGNQFELIQRTWSNALHFVLQRTGLDPICGQGEQLIGGQGWPSKYGNDSKAKAVSFDFSPYITLKGGEYFFAPSLSFLTNL
ncbi:MAG: Dyp-type peroxidase [Planctomycetaceae bacterium]|nr:Dyp-type peroxidase [Planctomycetaceae bacterium]